jgi:hypothetical protein
MAILEIIDEIDAYLSRLRQARELLLDGRTKTLQKRVHRRKKKVAPGPADHPAFPEGVEPTKINLDQIIPWLISRPSLI